MVRSLTLKLLLAFLLVSLTGAVLAAVFARWATFRAFDRLVMDQAQSNFIDQVSAYYVANGSWTGVASYLPLLRAASEPAPAPQRPPDSEGRPPPLQPVPFAFGLVDQDGYAVVPAGPYRIGERVPETELAQGKPLEVDGQVVGTILTVGELPPLGSQEERYLARTNQALLVAALGTMFIALVLGVFLARSLTRPVRELTAATRAMAHGELEQQVPVRSQDELGELAVSFNQMNADLARANDLRRQMTADIAHDLRGPLTVIIGYIESLRDGVLRPSPERFDIIYDEAQHLRCLVEDLRTLSLADAGELTLNRQFVAPEELLNRVTAAYSHPAQQQSIDLVVRADPTLPDINIDPERIVQVLSNLLSNALRHTPAGGQIVLSARRQDGAIQLAVQDNGQGISPQDLPHVFDRFYRGDTSRQADGVESGLGLAIAKSLVELHGGAISVDSSLGAGTTFAVALPADQV